MKDTKTIKKVELGIPWLSLFLAFLAYVFYGLKAAVVVGVLAYLSMGILALVGLVPIVGPYLYILAFNWLQAGLLSLAPEVQPNFIFSLIFVLGLAMSIIFTVIATVLVSAIIIGLMGMRR